MINSSKLLTTAALLLLSSVTTHTEAFGLVNTPIKPVSTVSPSFAVLCPTRHNSALCAEAGDSSKEEVEDETEQEVTAEATDEEEEQPEEATADIEEDEVDPEIKALKDQISEMESTLKQKNRDLSKLQDLADDYSEGGYGRKVAEMEGYRRSKSVSKELVRDYAGVSIIVHLDRDENHIPIIFLLHSLSLKRRHPRTEASWPEHLSSNHFYRSLKISNQRPNFMQMMSLRRNIQLWDRTSTTP